MIVTIILFILLIVFIFTTFNLLRKNEKQEDIINYQSKYINTYSKVINDSTIRLAEIDEKGSFEADDEIGWFFKEIKLLNGILNEYIIEENNIINEEKTKKTKKT